MASPDSGGDYVDYCPPITFTGRAESSDQRASVTIAAAPNTGHSGNTSVATQHVVYRSTRYTPPQPNSWYPSGFSFQRGAQKTLAKTSVPLSRHIAVEIHFALLRSRAMRFI